MNETDDLTSCQSFVLTALRSADEAITVEELATGEFSVDQFDANEIESALLVLKSRVLATQSFAGWHYVAQPGE